MIIKYSKYSLYGLTCLTKNLRMCENDLSHALTLKDRGYIEIVQGVLQLHSRETPGISYICRISKILSSLTICTSINTNVLESRKRDAEIIKLLVRSMIRRIALKKKNLFSLTANDGYLDYWRKRSRSCEKTIKKKSQSFVVMIFKKYSVENFISSSIIEF